MESVRVAIQQLLDTLLLWRADDKSRVVLLIQPPHDFSIVIAMGTIVCVLVIGFLFYRFTDAALPYLDSTASGMSVVAQLLLMRKKIENWILWIVVDILSIGIYTYKEVYLTAGLFFVFMLLCIQGLVGWRKEFASLNTERSEASAL